MTTLVTGGSGFIGRNILLHLQQQGRVAIGLTRNVPTDTDWRQGSLGDPGSLSRACQGITTIIHGAGYAHAFASLSGSDAAVHWQVNFEGTRNLIEAAGQAGAKQFVFLSSVKAMAEPGESCVDECFPGEPQTAYGRSKRAAEDAVLDAGVRYDMHVVNLRLTMVYGAGGRGNLERMGRLVRRGLFPPLPETGNRRSMVHVNDAVAAMCLVANDNRANGKTYIVAGPEAPSGRQLFDAMRLVSGLPECKYSVPYWLLSGAAACGDGFSHISRCRSPFDSEVLERLLGSACYSGARIQQELGWQSRVTLLEGLREMFSNEASI